MQHDGGLIQDLAVGEVELMRPGSAYRVSMELPSHAVPIKSFDYNPTSHEFYWSSSALVVIGCYYNVDIGKRSGCQVLRNPTRWRWIGSLGMLNVYLSQQSSSSILVC